MDSIIKLERQRVNAISLTHQAGLWLAHSHQPLILHLFDRACNLINEHGKILSIVTPQIGHGPFHLDIKDTIHFDEHLKLESPVLIQENYLQIGYLIIDMTKATHWDPQPNWKNLHHQRETILDRISHVSPINYPPHLPQFLLSTFSASIATADLSSATFAAKHLAGLGPGLTPSGDDFIMGALYAAWIMHPPDIASALAQAVAETAAPLTTSLSAAWLRSAGRGEAGNLWHELFDALASVGRIGNPTYYAMQKILAVGATSGADALSGFMNTFLYDRVNIQYE